MRYNDLRGVKTRQWFPNQMLRNDDINRIGTDTYQNAVDTLATMCVRDRGAEVLRGMTVTHTTAFTVSIAAGVVVSHEGYYMTGGTWGYFAQPGAIFAVILPEDISLGFDNTSGQTGDRIDAIDIRPVEENADDRTRNFKDPVTGIISTSPVPTGKQYTYEVIVRKGTASATPEPLPAVPGWVRLAEVRIDEGDSAIDPDNIIDIREAYRWQTRLISGEEYLTYRRGSRFDSVMAGQNPTPGVRLSAQELSGVIDGPHFDGTGDDDLEIVREGTVYADLEFEVTGDGGTGVLSLGDTGPGGGIIFYIDTDETPTQYWEILLTPAGTAQFNTDGTGTVDSSTDFGAGYDNTYNVLTDAKYQAAGIARDATNGGQDDWFLPSEGELIEAALSGIPAMSHLFGYVDGYDLWSSSGFGTNQASRWGKGGQWVGLRPVDEVHYVPLMRTFEEEFDTFSWTDDGWATQSGDLEMSPWKQEIGDTGLFVRFTGGTHVVGDRWSISLAGGYGVSVRDRHGDEYFRASNGEVFVSGLPTGKPILTHFQSLGVLGEGAEWTLDTVAAYPGQIVMYRVYGIGHGSAGQTVPGVLPAVGTYRVWNWSRTETTDSAEGAAPATTGSHISSVGPNDVLSHRRRINMPALTSNGARFTYFITIERVT